MGEEVSPRGSGFGPSSVHPPFLSRLPPSADLLVAVFLTFTGVTSVLGNGLVLLVHRRKRKKLKPPELMTVNLALCDLGFGLMGVPFFIVSSMSHAWVFGESGCLWYGIQGFVFGVGSLLTTCLISLDRCLKICCLRYGQWLEKCHVSLWIALMWLYTLFWAFLPVFGFGSYGPEPYGTSCAINWCGMTSSFSDRVYIFLILTLCFGFPALIMIMSYLAICLTVYRSNRSLASIPSSFVTQTRRDLRLAKMAAVVCATFLLAWTPYAAVSLISALIPTEEHEAADALQTEVGGSSSMVSSSPAAARLLNWSLVNWTTTEYVRHISSNHVEARNVTDLPPASILSPSEVPPSWTVNSDGKPVTRSPQPFCLSPAASLIPAMFAKSHCMLNPLIYQIMNREFRAEVYVMMFGHKRAERRRLQAPPESLCERKDRL